MMRDVSLIVSSAKFGAAGSIVRLRNVSLRSTRVRPFSTATSPTRMLKVVVGALVS